MPELVTSWSRLDLALGPRGLDLAGCDRLDPVVAGPLGPRCPVVFDTPLEAGLAAGLRALLADQDLLTVAVLPPAAWQRRMGAAVEALLAALGRPRVDLLLLDRLDAGLVKGGQPFAQLARQRDAGRCRGFGVVAQSLPAVRWIVDHTPAHVVLMGAEVAAAARAEPPDPAGKRARTADLLAEHEVGVMVSGGLDPAPDVAGPVWVRLEAPRGRCVPAVEVPADRPPPTFG